MQKFVFPFYSDCSGYSRPSMMFYSSELNVITCYKMYLPVCAWVKTLDCEVRATVNWIYITVKVWSSSNQVNPSLCTQQSFFFIFVFKGSHKMSQLFSQCFFLLLWISTVHVSEKQQQCRCNNQDRRWKSESVRLKISIIRNVFPCCCKNSRSIPKLTFTQQKIRERGVIIYT